jgi:hypothetical protein
MQHGGPHISDDVPDYAPYASLEALHRDVTLAWERFVRTNPLKKIDFEPDGLEEREARRALARLLHAPFGNYVDDELKPLGKPCGRATQYFATWLAAGIAELVDPDNKTRQYEFVRQRRRGRKGRAPTRPDGSHDNFIVYAINDQLAKGMQMKAAVADVAEKYGISRTDIYAARKRYRPRRAPPIAPNVMRPLPPPDEPTRPE